MSKDPEANSQDDFFDFEKYNKGAAQEAIEDLVTYINESGSVAIYDALNITRKEREHFEKELKDKIT